MSNENEWRLPALQAVDFDDLKDPTEDMIAAGKAMLSWRATFGTYNGTDRDAIDYGKEAIEAVKRVRDMLVARGEMFNNQASKVLTRLAASKAWEVRYTHGRVEFPQWDLLKYGELVGEAHELGMLTIVAAGYRPPNKRELAALPGFGGGR